MGAFLGRGLYVDRHKDTVAVAAVTSAAAAAILPWSAPSAAAQAAARAVCVEFGLQLYVSFIAGPTMIFNMERSAFGDIQSKLFPKYGLCTTAIGLWALAAAFFGANKDLSAVGNPFWILLSASVLNAVNWLGLFNAQISYLQRSKEEKDEKKSAAFRKKFGMYHGISMLVNLASMVLNIAFVTLT